MDVAIRRARPGDLELRRIYALDWVQGADVGARLIGAAVEAATLAGAPRLLLGVNAGNARAIAFDARHGFTGAGVRSFRVGDQVCDDLVLARTLTGSPAT